MRKSIYVFACEDAAVYRSEPKYAPDGLVLSRRLREYADELALLVDGVIIIAEAAGACLFISEVEFRSLMAQR